jgi:tetratricopeptide (TPR) repeat protein
MTIGINLVMIVRNESAVIERCLESVKPLLSRWLIVDTGSTDDTIEKITQALSDLPGEVHQREWVNFGHNRTEALELARGIGSHLLLIDADMTLRIEGELPDLTADAYELRHDTDPSYWTPRLIRSDREWSFVGRTHEYLECAEPFVSHRLTQLVIEDHADGGSRADKFERDRVFLEQAIAEDPNDHRALFYLALTLSELGETDAAITTFRQRVALGGWDQEVFYCLYKIGLLLSANDPNAGILQLLAAWNYRPSRAEPLLELARLHRGRGEYTLSALYASTGLALPASTDSAFVHNEAHVWALRFEHAIALYHLGSFAEALALNDQLLRDGVAREMEPWILHNRAWCLVALGNANGQLQAHLPFHAELPALGSLLSNITFTRIALDRDEGWSLFNPSISSDLNGELTMNIRSSNYVIAEDGSYIFHGHGEDGVVQSLNHLVRVADDLTLTSIGTLPLQPAGPPLRLSRVIGCEDVRLVHTNDGWRALATVRDRNHYERCDVAIITLDDIERPSLATIAVVPGPDPARHEKNWMPFVENGDLKILYLCAPTIVGHLDAKSNLVIESQVTGPPSALDFRGGSQGIDFENGFLFLVHEVSIQGPNRVYGHRFIHLTKSTQSRGESQWIITAMSRPFHLLHVGIEFVAGLARNGNTLIASFGVRDEEAWLVEFSATEVADLLVPLFQ